MIDNNNQSINNLSKSINNKESRNLSLNSISKTISVGRKQNIINSSIEDDFNKIKNNYYLLKEHKKD